MQERHCLKDTSFRLPFEVKRHATKTKALSEGSLGRPSCLDLDTLNRGKKRRRQIACPLPVNNRGLSVSTNNPAAHSRPRALRSQTMNLDSSSGSDSVENDGDGRDGLSASRSSSRATIGRENDRSARSDRAITRRHLHRACYSRAGTTFVHDSVSVVLFDVHYDGYVSSSIYSNPSKSDLLSKF